MPYYEDYIMARILAHLALKGRGGRPGVRHDQTCPICGRKLVNTYLRDREWKCRRCREDADESDRAKLDFIEQGE